MPRPTRGGLEFVGWFTSPTAAAAAGTRGTIGAMGMMESIESHGVDYILNDIDSLFLTYELNYLSDYAHEHGIVPFSDEEPIRGDFTIPATSRTLYAGWRIPILTPAAGQAIRPGSLVISWGSTGVAGARYELEIYDVSTSGNRFRVNIPNLSLPTSTIPIPSGLGAGTILMIRVTATAGGHTFSGSSSFVVARASGAPVRCPYPTDIVRGTARQYWEMDIGWPLGHEDLTENRGLNNISSGYGFRTHPITGAILSFHTGFDINQNNGAPILAVTSGYVIDISGGGQGFAISIRSDTLYDPMTGNPLIFSFWHMRSAPSTLGLRNDDRVERGDRIGYVGNTGASTGPHLHFDVSNHTSPWGPDRNRINPIFFYPVSSFTGDIEIREEILD